jgi:hypothetical protein
VCLGGQLRRGLYGPNLGANFAFVAGETHGRWDKAQPVPGLAALATGGFTQIDAISCASAGNCTAVGRYNIKGASGPQLFAVSETGGVWGTAEQIPRIRALDRGEPAVVSSISCASAGNCALAGNYNLTQFTTQAFVASQVGGTWAKAEIVPGIAALNPAGVGATAAVSCPAVGECTAGGYYTGVPGHSHAFTVTQTGATWAKAQPVPGTLATNVNATRGVVALSCASVGTCSAGGSYTDAAGHQQAFMLTQAHGTWHPRREVPGTVALNRGGNASVQAVSCPPTGPCGIAGVYTLNRRGAQEVFVTG